MLLPLLPLRCPCCKNSNQYVKVHYENEAFLPSLNECAHCKTKLVIQPVCEEKPNNIKISLQIHAIPEIEKVRGRKPANFELVAI